MPNNFEIMRTVVTSPPTIRYDMSGGIPFQMYPIPDCRSEVPNLVENCGWSRKS